MCYIELESCQVWYETKRRARKTHLCSCCKGSIAAGETYLIHFSVLDGDVTSEKCCGQCEEARDEFGEAHHNECGEAYIPTPSYFQSLLASCISEGDEESEVRWKPMLAAINGRRTEPNPTGGVSA